MRTLSVVLALSVGACAADSTWSGELGMASYASFETDVYPVLMRDCGFANCHGLEQRNFQVWGPGRSRLRTGDEDIKQVERLRTYARTLSMLYTDGSRPLRESPLLTKPLEISAGGATHAGADRYGRNVYRSQADPGFQVILQWARAVSATSLSEVTTASVPAGMPANAPAGAAADLTP